MKSVIYLKGGWWQNVKFVGDYSVKDGLISISWVECLQYDLVYVPVKLFGFIPWEKRSFGWVRADLPTTPNPYIVPLDSVSLIEEEKI